MVWTFKAYQDAVKKSAGTPPSLPALTQYTNDQLFFMAFGQVQEIRFSLALRFNY